MSNQLPSVWLAATRWADRETETPWEFAAPSRWHHGPHEGEARRKMLVNLVTMCQDMYDMVTIPRYARYERYEKYCSENLLVVVQEIQ